MKLLGYEIRKIQPPFKTEEGHVITEAFHDGTHQCYMLKDVLNSFCARAMDGLAHYERWQMRCDPDFLKNHAKAVDAVLRSKQVNIVDVVKLNNILLERLEWALPTEEIIWNFMAVAYFDKNESPYKYDDEYGKEKIKRWKARHKIEDFFLLTPIGSIIPLPQYSKEDLQLYLRVVKEMDKKHLELISGLQSPARLKVVS